MSENNRYRRPGQRTNPSSVASERPQRRKASVPKRQPRKRSDANAVKDIGTALSAVRAAISGALSRVTGFLQHLNRKLDRFRPNAAAAIVVDSALVAVAILIVLCIVAFNFSSLQMIHARSLVSSGKLEQASAVAQKVETTGKKSEDVIRLRQSIATSYIARSEFDAALETLSLMPTSEAAVNLAAQARKGKAEAFYQAGAYDEAAALFDTNAADPECASRYLDCLCAISVQDYLNGDEVQAQQLLIGTPDAADHIETAVRLVVTDEAQANELLQSGFFSADTIAHLQNAGAAVQEALKELPKGKIAVGDRHTVGLKGDGTVLATGDNADGQCEVSGWTEITMLAAGAKHTVGLRTDGTVVACGNNEFGQTNVYDWTDVVMIAATAYDTLALKSDGTVVTCGEHEYDVSAWRDVTMIAGGSYSAACVSKQGAVRTTHKGAQLNAGTLMTTISISGAYSAGVALDGSMISSFKGAPKWGDLVNVTAGPTAIFAITNTGELKAHFFRALDDPGILFDGEVVAIATSGTHHVFLTADGRVHAFGANGYGQIDVADWNL